jgi:hypothetical protein
MGIYYGSSGILIVSVNYLENVRSYQLLLYIAAVIFYVIAIRMESMLYRFRSDSHTVESSVTIGLIGGTDPISCKLDYRGGVLDTGIESWVMSKYVCTVV